MQMLTKTLVFVVNLVLANAFSRPFVRLSTNLACVGKTIDNPLPQPDRDTREDSDPSWRTAPSKIVAVKREKFNVRPELITFDAFNTLIEPSQSIGRWYREALNRVCDMKIRLPRPALFTAAFQKAYSDMSKAHPCFGALSPTGSMAAKEWWFEVVKNTYKNTNDLNTIEVDELDQLLPTVFELLYNDVFSTKEGWLLKDDAAYTLQKLREWRDQGAGPKIGIISNFDNRLTNVLTELGIADTFDFIITSEDARLQKPQREIFDLALKKANVSSAQAAYHVGESLDTDVVGATSAGWSPMRINVDFDNDFPDWTATDPAERADEGAQRRSELMYWGRRDASRGVEWMELWGLDDVLTLFGFPEDENKPIKTTYIRAFRED